MAFGEGFSAQSYVQSHGRDLYRRGMYTFWKRTVPPASLATFDAPDREKCTARRALTNTPLQALVLMNDPTYVEAARALAQRDDASKAAKTTRAGSATRSGWPPRASRPAAKSACCAGCCSSRLDAFRKDPTRGGEADRDRRVAARYPPRRRGAGGMDDRRVGDSESRRNDHQAVKPWVSNPSNLDSSPVTRASCSACRPAASASARSRRCSAPDAAQRGAGRRRRGPPPAIRRPAAWSAFRIMRRARSG